MMWFGRVFRRAGLRKTKLRVKVSIPGGVFVLGAGAQARLHVKNKVEKSDPRCGFIQKKGFFLKKKLLKEYFRLG